MKNIIQKYWFLIFIFLFSFFVFSFKIFSSVSFEGDLARDLYEILKISNSNLTLLGPKGSFGGLYTAPFYYYLFVPSFLLSGKEIYGIIIFNILLFSFSISFFCYFLLKKYRFFSVLFSGLILFFLPFMIFSARNPGNGFSHIPFFIIFLSILFFWDINKSSFLKSFLFGFLFG
ncbi:MAG: hypothetical protein N2Z85_01835, partial [Patescibacteria group bacterium]|nr:hypothetical protein [Patescibacteria group bacterium]